MHSCGRVMSSALAHRAAAACNTIEGAGQDIKNTGAWIERGDLRAPAIGRPLPNSQAHLGHEEHAPILAALARGEGEQARQHMDAHLMNMRARLSRRVLRQSSAIASAASACFAAATSAALI